MPQLVQLPDNVQRAVSTLFSVVGSLDARLASNVPLEEAVRSKKALHDVIRAVDALLGYLHFGEGPLAKGEDLKL